MVEYNVYCDESCHLEHDNSNVMVIGAVYCPKKMVKKINKDIYSIKERYGLPKNGELKWVKISNSNFNVYRALIEYFFSNNDLHFRAVIADKTNLNHKKYSQTHDDWYYKIYYTMLKNIFLKGSTYNIYIDIKYVFSNKKANKLHDVCCNTFCDFQHKMISKVQPIRSNEVEIMQLTDIIIGAIGYVNRNFIEGHKYSESKLKIIELIKGKSGYSLTKSSYYTDFKFNYLIWSADFYD